MSIHLPATLANGVHNDCSRLLSISYSVIYCSAFLANRRSSSSCSLLFPTQCRCCISSQVNVRLLSCTQLILSLLAQPFLLPFQAPFPALVSGTTYWFPFSSVPLFLPQVPASVFFFPPMITFFHRLWDLPIPVSTLTWQTTDSFPSLQPNFISS